MADKLAPEELRRLNTWAAAIAQHQRPDAPVAFTPEGVRVGRKGSLALSADGSWFDHEAGKGGPDTLSLIRHLRNCNAADATAWARTWLDRHPGDGELSADGAVEAAAEAGERRAAYAKQILKEGTDPIGTAAERYLNSRGLEPPYPSCVRFLPDARLGEGAIVGIITTADGEVAGVQVGYLDPDGRKSTILPQRQLYFLDRGAAEQAAFRIAVAEPAEGAAPLVIAEGLEDALSLAQSSAAKTVIGLPGVGRLGKFDLPAGTDAVMFRDGDAADKDAAKRLGEALDRWVLAGVEVRVTDTPPGEDANGLLLAKDGEELRRLVAEAKPAALSFDADVIRLAALPPLEYEKERAAAAQRHGVRISFIDAAVKAARAEAATAAADGDDEDEAPYPEPIHNVAEVLDAVLAQMRRYVCATEHSLAAAAVWAAHTHLLHREKIHLAISPKLAIQSPDRGCGKTTLLEVLGTLVPRPETGSSITAAAVFRLIEARKPTLLLDEADRIIRKSNEELLAVLNSSHRRSGAYVWRVVDVGGDLVPQKFSTWAGVAFAGIRELPNTLQDRSIVIRLSKAKPGEVIAHLRNGNSPTLQEIKRKLARWATDLTQLPEPPILEGLYNRAGDNWGPILAVAELAGDRWPQLIREAATETLAADQAESSLVALLNGIRRAFGERDRLRTRELLDLLLADDEFDWATANRGKAINDAFLRERLRNVISPAADGTPGSERWGSRNNKERGYSRVRFEDAWARYLPSPATPEHPAHPVHTAPPLKTNGNSGPHSPKQIRPISKSTRHRSPTNGGGPDGKARGALCESRHAAPKKSTKPKRRPGGPDGPHGLEAQEVSKPANGELGPEELL